MTGTVVVDLTTEHIVNDRWGTPQPHEYERFAHSSTAVLTEVPDGVRVSIIVGAPSFYDELYRHYERSVTERSTAALLADHAARLNLDVTGSLEHVQQWIKGIRSRGEGQW